MFFNVAGVVFKKKTDGVGKDYHFSELFPLLNHDELYKPEHPQPIALCDMHTFLLAQHTFKKMLMISASIWLI